MSLVSSGAAPRAIVRFGRAKDHSARASGPPSVRGRKKHRSIAEADGPLICIRALTDVRKNLPK
jgi:hypothetical protein